MSLEISPVKGDFVGVVSGISLAEPLAPDDIQAIHQGMDQFAVLVLPDQPLTNEQQVAFSRQLGPLQPAIGNNPGRDPLIY